MVPEGRHEYKFVVDGAWLADPSATESVPDGFGGQSLPRDYADLHAARLAAYDPVELATGTLRLILRKSGDEA